MNKKTLLATMSLAVLAACSTDDFQSQTNVAEESSSVQFELINGNDDVTRASWSDANKAVSFSAADGDLFTLYHGGTVTGKKLSGLENATYKAAGSPATLSTPSMIKAGKAIMVWPVDTAFNIKPGNNFAISIPVAQTDYVNQVPYVSDLINIGAYAPYTETPAPGSAYNTAGKDRKYPIFMRQMGSLLTLKTDYAGSDATIKSLETGTDPINPIELTEVKFETTGGGGTEFTKTIPVQFNAANGSWPLPATINHAWDMVTEFDVASITAAEQTSVLSAKDKSLLPENGGAKIIMLPQANIGAGVVGAAVTINTIYGQVVIAAPGVAGTQYSAAESSDAWIRYISSTTAKEAYETKAAAAETSGDNLGKFKTTSSIADGMMQTINWFSAPTRVSTNPTILNEPVGGLLTRYVKVLLNKLDMTTLHVKNDKHLYDAVRVWKEMGLASATVYLDGDPTTGEFEISQTTIAKIHEINAAAAEEATPRAFFVKPCNTAGEACTEIVITGGSNVPDLSFIHNNGGYQADVVLKAGESWSWSAKTVASKKAVIVDNAANGVARIVNKGTLTNGATTTLAVYNNTPAQMNIPFVNDGTWNVNAGDITVQFDVTNNNILNIAKGAEYHQDLIGGATATTFINDAQTLPERFFMNDPSKTAKQKAAFKEKIGVVNNSGVFAVTGTTTVKGIINNYSLIEHADDDAKTYITRNELAGSSYASPWAAATNKLGRINLPFSNRLEDNISISSGLATGFVSVTVATGKGAPLNKQLNAATVGEKVNYVIINSGVEKITEMSNKIKYIEFNDEDKKEIAWDAGTSTAPKTATYQGLIVFSPVNIKLYTNVNVAQSTYLAAKVYVGGSFTPANYAGYYGNTASNVTSMVITW